MYLCVQKALLMFIAPSSPNLLIFAPATANAGARRSLERMQLSMQPSAAQLTQHDAPSTSSGSGAPPPPLWRMFESVHVSALPGRSMLALRQNSESGALPRLFAAVKAAVAADDVYMARARALSSVRP